MLMFNYFQGTGRCRCARTWTCRCAPTRRWRRSSQYSCQSYLIIFLTTLDWLVTSGGSCVYYIRDSIKKSAIFIMIYSLAECSLVDTCIYRCCKGF